MGSRRLHAPLRCLLRVRLQEVPEPLVLVLLSLGSSVLLLKASRTRAAPWQRGSNRWREDKGIEYACRNVQAAIMRSLQNYCSLPR
jgi:hypothetical protein